MTFVQVLIGEFIKLRRSKITWLSWAAISVMPLVAGAFMWIVMEPERAGQLGLLGQKAQFTGATANWPSFFLLLLQTMGIGGMILVAVLTAYVVGREYADGTIKNLLALPIGRHEFAAAKLLVVFVWFAALTTSFVLEGLVVGGLLDLPGYAADDAMASVGDLYLSCFAAWLLVPVVAWVAALGRGYLAPLAFTIFMLVLGMVIGATGWGKWFPWSVVPLFAGVAGPPAETLAPGSLAVLGATFVIGTVALILHLRYADHIQ